MVQDYLTPAMFSRWRPEKVHTPYSNKNTKDFAASLLKLAKTKKYTTIFPINDTSLITISENRKKLLQYIKLALPSHKDLMKTIDKSKTLKLAKKIGLPIPKTFYTNNNSDIHDIATKIQYPAVIKPRKSWEFRKGKSYFSHPFYANSASDLISTYEKVRKVFPAPMIQEYIPGQNQQIGLIFDHGNAMAACAIREHRTFPVTGGQSVLRETINLDPTTFRYASNLLKSLNWHGIAEVEFRVDSRDLKPKLMEVNPRFWGSINVAIKSGVDFPYIFYLLVEGKQINPIFKYNTGIKSRSLTLDIKNFKRNLRNKTKLAQAQPVNKFKVIMNFLKIYETNLHYDGLKLSDPLPFLMENTLSTYVNTKEWIKQKMKTKT